MAHISLKTLVGCITLVAAINPLFAAQQEWTLLSPDQSVAITLKQDTALAATLSPDELYYSVTHGSDTIVEWSPLGLSLSEPRFSGPLTFSTDSQTTVDETYTLVTGKHSRPRNNYSQRKVGFVDSAGLKLSVFIRAYDDGAAFCYEIDGVGNAAISNEYSGFVLPEGSTAWMQEMTKNYESVFDSFTVGDSGNFGNYGCFPLLMRTNAGKWALLTEAAVYESYAASRYKVSNTVRNLFQIRLPHAPIVSDLPWRMPWRVVVAGDNLGDIVETNLIENLNPTCALSDLSWIKPGRVAWSWWSNGESTGSFEVQKQYVDFASQMGWEYVLVDEGWRESWIGDLVEYATPKGIGILVWYRWTDMDAPSERSQVMSRLSSWGVKGIKVDFIDNDGQDRMRFYNAVLADAANHQLLVNFHGSTLPRGQRRRWPNLMTMEAVRGAEHYRQLDANYGYPGPWQNCILPFTRNVVGPMDYTPVTFSTPNRQTTDAHELALSVVFESGLQHFADSPESYNATAGSDFLKVVPAAWDDTRFIAGYPGEFACLARRNGDDWYFAGINAATAQREVTIPTSTFLKPATYQVTLYLDSANGEIRTVDTTLDTQFDLSITMLPNGGFCFRAGDSYDSTNDSISIFNTADRFKSIRSGVTVHRTSRGYDLLVYDPGEYTVRIVDAQGKHVSRKQGRGQKSLLILATDLTSGMNVVRVKTGNKTYVRRIVNQ